MSGGQAEPLIGVLLCRAAGRPLAFPAMQVAAVEPWVPGRGIHHAAEAFSHPARRGRALIAFSGGAVAVETIEVHRAPLKLLPIPEAMRGGLRGGLIGFVMVREALWPVMEVEGFAAFLSA